MSIVRLADLAAVPWKNGLGITREIAVFPAGASMDAFVWRASLADVDTASPFSVFAGIDRSIVLLSGDGFTMTLDDAEPHALTTPCVPFAFAGEAQVTVALAGGATRDFNLMVRRGQARGHIDVVRGPLSLDAATDTVLLHMAQGRATIDGVAVARGDTARAPRHAVLDDGAIALAVRVTQAT